MSGAGAAILAYGAVSALGEGADAFSAGLVGEAPRVGIARDEELARAGFARPFAARAALREGGDAEVDRATRVLASALAQCVRGLSAVRPAWRSARVGLALGTSSGGMRSAERLFARVARGHAIGRDEAARAAYFGPLLDAVAELDLVFAPATLVLCACASSAIAVGLASRWLADGACDLALAGGFDALGPFVASGFESLQATSARVPPRPFRVGRDGMALGEGAAVVALSRIAEADAASALGYVTGFGASADAVHLTAPDRSGAGLARAARAALADAGDPTVDLVSAHATATPFNDAAESRAIRAALGDDARPVIHAFKAQVGHTLGAAGALESLAALDALTRGVHPATAGATDSDADPDAPARLFALAEPGAPRVALKLASAFGGANAALVLTRDRPSSPARVARSARSAPREVWVTRAVSLTSPPALAALAEALGVPLDKLARADAQVTWSLAALAALAARLELPTNIGAPGLRDVFGDAGIVVGTAAATLETNALFAARLRDRGPRFVEPRRFPYTSPNAASGECGVVFGLRGPSFATGAGLHAALEALVLAADVVRAGDAERMLVVAVDDVAHVASTWSAALGAPLTPGATALLVTRDRLASSVARVASTSLTLGPAPRSAGPAAPAHPVGHLALAPLALLTSEAPPARLESSSALLATYARAVIDFSAI